MKIKILMSIALIILLFAFAIIAAQNSIWYFGLTQVETIKIGIICAQTGPVSSTVAPSQEGIRMALEDWGSQNKKTKFKLIFEDTGGESKNAVTAFEKLNSIDNITAIITDISSTTKTLVPLTQENKLPMISYISTSSIAKEKGEYAFRTSPMNYKEMELISKYLEIQKIKKVAIITELNDYPVSMKTLFIKQFTASGGTIVAQEEVNSNSDYRTVLTKINNSNPQAIIIIPISTSVALNLLQTKKELNINTPVYGSDIVGALMVVNKGGLELQKDVIFGSQVYDENKVKILQERYINKIGNNNVMDWLYIATSYDAAMLLFNAIEDEGTNNEKIKEHLKNTKYTGYSGEIEFDSFGDPKEAQFALFKYNSEKKRDLVYK